jgi:TorA maturation chaperone TorD
MRENNIAFEMQQNEPEDHFGTLLLLAAWLAENGREAGVRSASGVAPAAVEHPLPVWCLSTTPGIRFMPRWAGLRS